MKTAEAILNALRQPVLVLDEKRRPLLANPVFFQTFDLEPKDLAGKFISEFISGNACEPPLRTLLDATAAAEMQKEELETQCTLPNGRRIFLMVSTQHFSTSGLSQKILVEPRDVTKEKNDEQRIKELNDALREHVTTIDAVNKELESYSHSVSHDLRTPLRFVNRIAHVLLSESGARLSKSAAEQVSMILQATGEMTKLIESLLVFSQVSLEPIKKRRMDLRRLFEGVMNELQYAQEDSGAQITLEDLAPCLGDRTLLKEVAVNLLTNALKFTRRREGAQITIGCIEQNGEPVYFVRDNGVGFDLNDSESLFLPFQKLHKEPHFEGIGIGLALTQRIVERHGGRIWAESKPNKGATFYFTLGQ